MLFVLKYTSAKIYLTSEIEQLVHLAMSITKEICQIFICKKSSHERRAIAKVKKHTRNMKIMQLLILYAGHYIGTEEIYSQLFYINSFLLELFAN